MIAGGLALTAGFAFAAAAVPGYVGLGVLFVLGGARAAASTSAASGRVVIGWFPRSRRGLAMGIRQISQPLGVAVAALAVPAAGRPPRHLGAPAAGGRARRGPRRRLRRRHRQPAPGRPRAPSRRRRAAVQPRPGGPVPDPHPPAVGTAGGAQFTLSTFGLIWLITGLHWNVTAAGAVIAAAQLVGALGRIAGRRRPATASAARTRVLRLGRRLGRRRHAGAGGLRRAAPGPSPRPWCSSWPRP